MERPDIYAAFDIALSEEGYFRHPAVHKDQLVFVSEDDLWTVPLSGGVARRLTGAEGRAEHPAISPCGQWLAYTSTEQGCPEVFVMPTRGGSARKLTFSGARRAQVVGFSPDGEQVIFCSNLREPFLRQLALYAVPVAGGAVQPLGLGAARSIAFGPDNKGRVLARHRDDLAYWKGYQGGEAGELWIDGDGSGNWQRLLPQVSFGLCRPMWIGERIYFLTDKEGTANVYSCTVDGQDLRRHTDHEDHYVRFASHYETTLVYSVAGTLYRLDTTTDEVERIEVDYASPRVDLKPKYVAARDYLDDFALHPQGHSLTVTSRGKIFSFGNWEGAVRQLGKMQGVRYRLARHLNDGERLLVVSDEGGEERFEIHPGDGSGEVLCLSAEELDPGRPIELLISPTQDEAIFANHRHEILHLDLSTGALRVLDRSPYDRIAGMAFSPDGRWVAYGFYESASTSVIKICDLDSGECHSVTSGDFQDVQPAFDPEGRYLYFLSYRHFDPVYDQLFFELSFPRGMKPCVVTLRSDLDSPFVHKPRPLDGDDDDDSDNDGRDESRGEEKRDDEEEEPAVEIEFEGIEERMELFPVSEGNYGDIAATADRVFWTIFPVAGALGEESSEGNGVLQTYNFKKRKVETFAEQASTFTLDSRSKTLALWDGDELWVTSTSGDGPDFDTESATRESGLINLERISLAVEPRAEWCQMMREAWRLMRDHFWREDMNGVDWAAVWERYKGLLARVSSRTEFSDLVWTMQGELGTSHAYELGGDYRQPPQYQPGFLGAEYFWDQSWRLKEEEERFSGGYRIERILKGDAWDATQSSPLLRSGVRVKEGDVILGINGQRLSERVSPGQLLANQACSQVELLVAAGDGSHPPRKVTVRTLSEETSLRYREWVSINRRTVHEATEGKIGYVHIPDMGPTGYAEFHRHYLSESRRQGLVVDVRHNGGGHVSQLILEKLARKPLGFDVQRWGKEISYPQEAVAGPLVALTNEFAGSDGDIFSHCFKLMELGPLLGKRTWGGVIGVFPRHELVDGSVTTQPEFSFWFKDVGFGVENWGTEPDETVEFVPESGAGPADPQLKAAIEKALALLTTTTILEPPKI